MEKELILMQMEPIIMVIGQMISNMESWPDRVKYERDYIDGKKDGKVKLTFDNQNYYEDEFK